MADLAAFRALPAAPFEACEKRTARVSSTSLVRYRMQRLLGADDVRLPRRRRQGLRRRGRDPVRRGRDRAAHSAPMSGREFVFDPLHYLALIEQKPGALDQAAPLQGWDLSPSRSPICAACWKRAWATGASASSSRCCG